MNLETATEQFRKAAEKMPSIGKSVKFQFEVGIVHLDLSGDEAVVTNEDKEADTTIITSLETMEGLRKGKVNPMMAIMSGKIKIKGDMGLAMKLQSLFT